jgi:hypothetical protein
MGFNANTTHNISLFWYYIKQIINVFIRAMVRIFSLGISVKDGMFHSTRLSPRSMEHSIFHLIKIFVQFHSQTLIICTLAHSSHPC